MSRLLHAAARGARLQARMFGPNEIWFETPLRPRIDGDFNQFRIHPEDTELQYGPISTALREFVINDEWATEEVAVALEYLDSRFQNWSQDYRREDFGCAVLFMAEALADEGM